jgi:hypothetical protein
VTAKKCSVCAGGVFYGQHYPGCPRARHAKHAPSLTGYGVFLHSSGNSYVVRSLDNLQRPYSDQVPVKVFKVRAAAERLAEKLTFG